jgi:2-phospho-L-lactate guanylyltransferase
MATGVVRALTGIDVHIACDDEGVREWAVDLGATVIWGAGLGLNGAIDDGIATIAAEGYDHVLVSHADIPRPASLRGVARPGAITLVPDRRRDGTNVMSFPVTHRIAAAYGAGSFSRHLTDAQSHSITLEIRNDPELSLDIDTPDDLNHPLISEVLPTWLRTTLANHS